MARVLGDDALLGILDSSTQLMPSRCESRSPLVQRAHVPKELEDQNDHREH